MIQKIYTALIPEEFKNNPILYSNATNIVNAAIIAIIAIPLYSLMYYFLNFHLAAKLILLLIATTGFSILSLKYFKSVSIARELFVAPIFFWLIALSYILGGMTSSLTFWLMFPPFLTLIFGGLTSGIVWGILGLISVFIFYLLPMLNVPQPTSPVANEMVLRFFSISGLITITFVLMYFFQKSKIEATNKLALAKEEADFLFEKAQEAFRLKNEILANISHEFYTPLNTIIGFVELMQEGKINKDLYPEYYKDILLSSNVLKQMIKNILDISKIEFGKMEFHPELVHLDALADEMKKIHHSAMTEKKLNFIIQIDPTIKKIVTDPLRLRQIFLNFISNSIKFTPKGGKIDVRAFPISANELRIEIKDTGIGIREEDLHKLFIPFQQIDSSITKKYQGTGIGLALVRRIVEGQGGQVGVQSIYGKGSIFYVILPFVK